MFTPFAFIQPLTTFTPITPTLLQYLLLGGSFTLYNAPVLGGIAKLDSTGSLDPSFNMGSGQGGTPYFFIQQPDGKYLMGGFNITSYSGSSNNRVVRINQDGTKDNTFILGTGFNNSPYDAKSYSDNSNIIVGNFLTYSGSTVNGLVKVTPSGSIDTSFNTGFSFQNSGIGPAQVVALQSDGKAIVGVQSNQYSSSNNALCRTDLSGSYNAGPGTTFNYGLGGGLNGFIYTAVTQSDGKIILGGTFTTYSGSSVNRIVRINPNGTRDNTFNVGFGFPTDVNELKIQPDGKIIAVGAFTTYSGSSSNIIVRINPNGTRDTSFNVGTGFSAAMNRIQIQPDGKILVGGQATTYSGSTINFLTRLTNSGSIDPTFDKGTGFNAGGAVYGLALQPDGKILAAGGFTTYSGSSTNTTRIIRINPSGSQDTSFVTGAGFTNVVYNLALEPTTDKIVVVGGFTGYSGSSGTNVTRIVRLNPDGTRDTSLISGTGISTFTTPISHLSVESDGKIYVGAGFTTYSGSVVNNFVRINPSGSIDSTFPLQLPASRAGFNTTVRSLFISSSNIYFFGDFSGFRSNAGGLIRINTDGTHDTTFATGNNIATGGTPSNFLLQNDGKLIVIGSSLGNYSGSSLVNSNIFRLNTNGTIDNTFNIGTGPNGSVISAAAESSGKIVLIGTFTTYSGSTANRIVRINDSGSRDTSFNIGTGFNAIATSVKNSQVIVTPDNSVYVVSTFSSYSGSTANRIVKIQPSGAIDTTFITSSPPLFGQQTSGFTNPGTVIVQSGSSVLVGGFFTSYKNININFGPIIDSTGAVSSSFNIGTGFNSTVQSWATQSDGKILASGGFTAYSGSFTNTTRIVRINPGGTIDNTFNIGTGFNATVRDIRIQSDGKIIAVGDFTAYSGSILNGIVRINPNGTRDTSFNIGAGFSTNTQNHCKIQPDGKIVVVGQFTTYSGSTSNRIVRINTDGTRDTSFNVGTGLVSTGESIILQPDGKMVVTGNFTIYSGSTSNRIVRINTDGTRDTSFNIGNGLSNSGTALALQSDGKIICANLSQTYSGSTNRYIIRINTNGTLDNTFNANANASLGQTTNTPNSLVIDASGSIYWGNSFTTFSGSFTPNRIVKLNTNGSVDETFNQTSPNFVNNTGKGANGTVTALLLL
jgi:uncharacterized delta-60 repeat protein